MPVFLADYGVFYFRKVFDLASVPGEFIVHGSADNRYELYVNGRRVTLGPAWGDLHHWRFESLDIAPYLTEGENIIAAQVVNFGHLRAVSQISYKSGFILQGNSEREALLRKRKYRAEVFIRCCEANRTRSGILYLPSFWKTIRQW